MDDPGSPLFGSIILILTLTAVNAFLAGAEMAFVSLNPAKIKEMAEKLGMALEFEPKALYQHAKVDGFINKAKAARPDAGCRCQWQRWHRWTRTFRNSAAPLQYAAMAVYLVQRIWQSALVLLAVSALFLFQNREPQAALPEPGTAAVTVETASESGETATAGPFRIGAAVPDQTYLRFATVEGRPEIFHVNQSVIDKVREALKGVRNR